MSKQRREDLSKANLEGVADLLGEGLADASSDDRGEDSRASKATAPGKEAAQSTERGAPVPGVEIPGYQIVREIGRGGMGRVFESVQLSTRRTVALKVMLEGALASEKARRRFEREVRIAAGLRHPNIAQIYESGLHESHYWFAMELVDGQPLDAFAEARALSTRDRLSLMATVCEAVGYAHEQGVIHRDLKPSNILVSNGDEPHVLDFGLAKLEDPERTHDVTLSAPGELMGTPAYMSPEQTTRDPSKVDARSDVYSLGVVLYRLLTGQFPYSVGGRLDEVVREIATADPTPPSRIHAELRGEAEAIILKAIGKNCEQRYPTATELAEDLRCLLAGEPVRAKLPSGTYRLRKALARRGRPLVGAVVLMAAIAAAVLITRVWVSRSAQPEATLIVAETEVVGNGQWIAEKIIEGEFERLSLALSPSGETCISFRDAPKNQLRCAFRQRDGWRIELVDYRGGTLGMGTWHSLKFGTDGVARIAYSSSEVDSICLKYAHRDGPDGLWIKEDVNLGNDMGYDCCLALTAQNQPRISHECFQGDYNKDLMYSWYDGSTWHTEAVYTAGWVGAQSCIALDGNGEPHIAHQRCGDDSQLLYTYRDATGWHTVEKDAEGIGWCNPSIVLDSRDRAHFVYRDQSRDVLKYMDSAGAVTWLGDGDAHFAFALDEKNTPHIAYIDPASNELRYATHEGNNWNEVLVDRVGSAGHVALALDPDGSYIAYLENGEKTQGWLKLGRRRKAVTEPGQ